MEKKIIVYKFWASWCAPCRMYAPVFDKVAEELKNIVEFVAVNAEEDEDKVTEMGVRNLPTTIIYDSEKKEVIDRRTGAMSHDDLANWVKTTVTLVVASNAIG